MVLNNNLWDERNIAFSENGSLIYSDDRSGIFNLYLVDDKNEKQGYATNVFGGAFMPNINKSGKVLYSLYDNGGYKIAIIDSLQLIDETLVGYSKTHYQKNGNLSDPILMPDTTKAHKYVDQFPNMFIMPKVMAEYGTCLLYTSPSPRDS